MPSAVIFKDGEAGSVGGNAISATSLTVNGGLISADGGYGGNGGNGYDTTEYQGACSNGGDGGNGAAAVFANNITVNAGEFIARGGRGGYGGNGGKGCSIDNQTGGNGGNGGNGGVAISAENLTVVSGRVVATGGVGIAGGNGNLGDGVPDGEDGTDGSGGTAISVKNLIVNDGSITANGGKGDGGYGSGVVIKSGGKINGTIAVRNTESDFYAPLPEGKSISEYRFARITKEIKEDSLTLNVAGNRFTVTAEGEDAGTGFVVVALYDGNRLAEIKLFDLSKAEPQSEFTASGDTVIAYWIGDTVSIAPLCEAVEAE